MQWWSLLPLLIGPDSQDRQRTASERSNVHDLFSVRNMFFFPSGYYLKITVVLISRNRLFHTHTVAAGVAFGGQSQSLPKPMLLNGPRGGRPKAVQITKPHTMMTAIPNAMERLVMPCSLGRLSWQPRPGVS